MSTGSNKLKRVYSLLHLPLAQHKEVAVAGEVEQDMLHYVVAKSCAWICISAPWYVDMYMLHAY